VNSAPITTPSSTTRAVELAQVLQEDHDLEALAVDRGEAEDREAEQHRVAGSLRVAGEQAAAAAIVVTGDPAGPVDLVEEPVHHEQQHEQRRQAGGRLDVELAAVEAADQPDDAEPGRDPREDRGPAADGDGLAVDAVGAEEARGDRRQHEDRLEALAEDEDRAVDHHGRVAEPIAARKRRRVRRAAPRTPAEHDHRHRDGEHKHRPDIEEEPRAARASESEPVS
jgi:hypothetical protein